jgi:hypothetical protein
VGACPAAHNRALIGDASAEIRLEASRTNGGRKARR